MNIEFINRIPEDLSHDVKSSMERIVKLIESTHSIKIDDYEKRELYNELRATAMCGFNSATYITQNLARGISTQMIDIQFEKTPA